MSQEASLLDYCSDLIDYDDSSPDDEDDDDSFESCTEDFDELLADRLNTGPINGNRDMGNITAAESSPGTGVPTGMTSSVEAKRTVQSSVPRTLDTTNGDVQGPKKESPDSEDYLGNLLEQLSSVKSSWNVLIENGSSVDPTAVVCNPGPTRDTERELLFSVHGQVCQSDKPSLDVVQRPGSHITPNTSTDAQTSATGAIHTINTFFAHKTSTGFVYTPGTVAYALPKPVLSHNEASVRDIPRQSSLEISMREDIHQNWASMDLMTQPTTVSPSPSSEDDDEAPVRRDPTGEEKQERKAINRANGKLGKLKKRIGMATTEAEKEEKKLDETVRWMDNQKNKLERAMMNHVKQVHDSIDYHHQQARDAFNREQEKYWTQILEAKLEIQNYISRLSCMQAEIQGKHDEIKQRGVDATQSVPNLCASLTGVLSKEPKQLTMKRPTYSLTVPEVNEDDFAALVGSFSIAENSQSFKQQNAKDTKSAAASSNTKGDTKKTKGSTSAQKQMPANAKQPASANNKQKASVSATQLKQEKKQQTSASVKLQSSADAKQPQGSVKQPSSTSAKQPSSTSAKQTSSTSAKQTSSTSAKQQASASTKQQTSASATQQTSASTKQISQSAQQQSSASAKQQTLVFAKQPVSASFQITAPCSGNARSKETNTTNSPPNASKKEEPVVGLVAPQTLSKERFTPPLVTGIGPTKTGLTETQARKKADPVTSPQVSKKIDSAGNVSGQTLALDRQGSSSLATTQATDSQSSGMSAAKKTSAPTLGTGDSAVTSTPGPSAVTQGYAGQSLTAASTSNYVLKDIWHLKTQGSVTSETFAFLSRKSNDSNRNALAMSTFGDGANAIPSETSGEKVEIRAKGVGKEDIAASLARKEKASSLMGSSSSLASSTVALSQCSSLAGGKPKRRRSRGKKKKKAGQSAGEPDVPYLEPYSVTVYTGSYPVQFVGRQKQGSGLAPRPDGRVWIVYGFSDPHLDILDDKGQIVQSKRIGANTLHAACFDPEHVLVASHSPCSQLRLYNTEGEQIETIELEITSTSVSVGNTGILVSSSSALYWIALDGNENQYIVSPQGSKLLKVCSTAVLTFKGREIVCAADRSGKTVYFYQKEFGGRFSPSSPLSAETLESKKTGNFAPTCITAHPKGFLAILDLPPEEADARVLIFNFQLQQVVNIIPASLLHVPPGVPSVIAFGSDRTGECPTLWTAGQSGCVCRTDLVFQYSESLQSSKASKGSRSDLAVRLLLSEDKLY